MIKKIKIPIDIDAVTIAVKLNKVIEFVNLESK